MRIRRSLSAVLGGALFLTMSGPVVMAAGPGDTSPGSPPGGSALTRPATGAPADLALAYATSHAASFGVSAGHAKSLYVAKELPLTNGGTAVHLGQRVDGLRVRDANLAVVVAADGRIMSAAGHLVSGTAGGTSSVARLTARAALDAAAARQGATASRALKEAEVRTSARREFPNVYGVGNAADRPVLTELVWYPSDQGRRIQLAWLTDIESSGQAWWETVVDAQTGTVLDRLSRYAHAGPEGTVTREQHPEAPGATRQVTPFTGLDGSWVSGTTTSGNNVNAYLDRNDDDANNEYQPTTPGAGDPSYQHFNYTFTDAWRTTANLDSLAALDADRDAATTQLFYYTNVMHDWLYAHGFDEASGNFQVDNFTRGGSGSDPVLAEAQDGWDFGCVNDMGTQDTGDDLPIRCLNNANFGTPADGSSPRMQMYMWAPTLVPWNPTMPYRDGDVDGDVIAHEYGHGVSSRLVGGGALGYNGGDQRGALGEGWSDVVSYLKWDDAVVGEYVTGNATTGIRAVAYDNSTLDFQDYDTSSGSGHGNGQIWATVLYDIRAQIPGGVHAMADLVLDGMKSTVQNPTFINARDGLLATDAAGGGTNRCLIWSAFAGRGLGTASTTGLDTVPTFSDAVPPECLPTADADGPYTTPEGADVQLDGTGSAKGTDPSAGAMTAYAWDLDNDGSYDDATGATPSFTTVGQDGVLTIGLQVTDALGNTSTDTSTVTVTNVAPTVVVDAITPIDEGGWVTITGTVTDPGWLDPLTATIAFGDGAAAIALTGTLESVRPNTTLIFSVDHQYGDDGAYPVQVCAADDDTTGNCGSTVANVANVAPTVVVDAITPIDEGGWVTITGTVTDPGWLDPVTATIAFDDGAAPVALAGVLENVQPDATLTFSVNHQYGDDGAYPVQVCAADDDTTGNCGSTVANVANVAPTAVIDGTGVQVYDGVSAFILEAGEDLTVPVGSEDPGSDDLTFGWAWGDTLTDSQTSLVNPPALDPAKSPSVQPRDVDLSATHAYAGACAYTLTATVTDDDGGSASDTAVVLITGNADVSKGHGWWLNQYRTKAPNDFTTAELECYLTIVGTISLVFHEERDVSTRAMATKVLNAPSKAPEKVIFDQMALGAWLNFANGSIKLDTPVDTDGDLLVDSTFGAAMLTAETVRLNPASTLAEVKAQKSIVERLALQSAP